MGRKIEGLYYRGKIVFCDICKKSCRPLSLTDEYCEEVLGFDPMEYMTMKDSWGYFSENPNRDTEVHKCVMCQPCYEKVKGFIESLGGKINISNYLL